MIYWPNFPKSEAITLLRNSWRSVILKNIFFTMSWIVLEFRICIFWFISMLFHLNHFTFFLLLRFVFPLICILQLLAFLQICYIIIYAIIPQSSNLINLIFYYRMVILFHSALSTNSFQISNQLPKNLVCFTTTPSLIRSHKLEA